MAKREPKSLFQRLSRLFKSGPVVKRKIRGYDTLVAGPDASRSSGALLFQKSTSPTYTAITSNAYNLSERLMRYEDFQQMEQTPEISSALDIYADETVSQDSNGRSLHIFSDNEKIKEVLEDLFYNTLNTEFNLRSWARNLAKFGDMFAYIDVSPDQGVVNAFPIPVNEIEREEGYDRSDPSATRFRWVTLGNRVLENWEIAHFRLLGNDMFLPYGSSLIEPARRVWRQLILIEDAMLVYRVVRAPERRVFYIDVANLPPENVPMYVEEQRKNLRTSTVMDKTNGRSDLRYNPMSIDEDYFIPIRGGESGTKIDTLAGGQNAAAVEDVAYIQKKLFAALKVPKAYLGYEEGLASKATLAQLDIRFARTVNVIQRTILAELNKIAVIHLYANGFDGDDLQDFTLRLSNPSTVAQQQKLELWRSKFEIAGTMPEGMGSREFVQTEIWGLSKDQIAEMNDQRLREKLIDASIEAGGSEADDAPPDDEGADVEDIFADDAGEPEGEETPPGEENAGEEPDEDRHGVDLLTSAEDRDDNEVFSVSAAIKNAPVNVKHHLDRALYNRSRRRHHGASQTFMPDLKAMTDDASSDPYDSEWLRSVVSNPLGESKIAKKRQVAPDTKAMLEKMASKLGIVRSHVSADGLLVEGIDVQDEVDAIEVDLGPRALVNPWEVIERDEEEDDRDLKE